MSSSSLGDEGLKSVLDAVESERDDGSSSPTVRRMDVRARADLLTAEGAMALFDRLSAWGDVEAAWFRRTDDEDATVVTGGNGTGDGIAVGGDDRGGSDAWRYCMEFGCMSCSVTVEGSTATPSSEYVGTGDARPRIALEGYGKGLRSSVTCNVK